MNSRKILTAIGTGITVTQLARTAIRFIGNHDTEYRNIGNYRVKITYDPALLGMQSAIAATWSIDQVAREAEIVIDNLFNILSEDEQNVVIAHELGHMIKDGGLTNDYAAYYATRLFGFCPKEEFIADSYAVELYGKTRVIDTLKKIGVIMGIQSAIEITQRIAHIKAH